MANPILAHGAYGKHYKTKAELLKAWEDGADFKIWGGPYMSIRDLDYMMEIHGRIILSYGNDNYHVIERED